MKSYNGRVNSLDPNLDFDKDSVVELIKEASMASDEETKEPSGYINSKINLYHDVCKSPMVSLIKEALKLP